MTASSIHRPTLTTEQWKRVFTALDKGASAVELEEEPEIAGAVAYFHATQSKDAQETKSFVHVADALLVNSKLAAGQRCGSYALIESIARGGMGSVWRARREDGLYQSEVAVKLLGSLALSAQARARFAREGELLARLSHPHIARLLDAGLTEDMQRYLVIELVQGVDIATFCKTLPPYQRIALFRQLLSAVSYAHSQLILHRDIKPGNVLVDTTGQVKLLDFGVAKFIDVMQNDDDHDNASADSDRDLTRVVGAAFTESYAAPEQVRGELIGTQADVFALGSVLFELVLGERLVWLLPKRDWLAHAVANRLKNNIADVHPDLTAVLSKATAADASERYATVAEFDDDLARYLASEPVRARATTRGYRAMKFIQRNRFAVSSSALATCAVIASLAFALFQLADAREQQRIAAVEASKANEISKFTTSLFTVLDPKVASTIDRSKLTAKQILDIGRERIRTELHDQPDTRLALLGTLAEMYGRLEQEEEFASLNDERRRLAQQHYGEHHPIVYDAMQTDLWSDIYSGDFAGARSTLEKLDAGARSRGESEKVGDERAANRLHAWAEIMRSSAAESGEHLLSRYRRAIAAFDVAKTTSPDHAAAIGNYGVALLSSNRPSDAVEQFDKALNMMEQARTDKTHVVNEGDVFLLLGGRGRAHQALKRYVEAEQDLRSALELAGKSSGFDHVLTKQMRANLAYFLHSTERRDEAWREMKVIDATTAPQSVNIAGMNQVRVIRARMLLAESQFDQAAELATLSIQSWRLANNSPARLREAEALLAEIKVQRDAASTQSPKR
jgi:eukaryotic-like serine/threonine-protein kinase